MRWPSTGVIQGSDSCPRFFCLGGGGGFDRSQTRTASHQDEDGFVGGGDRMPCACLVQKAALRQSLSETRHILHKPWQRPYHPSRLRRTGTLSLHTCGFHRFAPGHRARTFTTANPQLGVVPYNVPNHIIFRQRSPLPPTPLTQHLFTSSTAWQNSISAWHHNLHPKTHTFKHGIRQA